MTPTEDDKDPVRRYQGSSCRYEKGLMSNPIRPPSITSARAGASVDTSARTKRYVITMAIRTACFLLAVTVAGGWLRWALLAGAVFLPYMGVLLANQANDKGRTGQARPDVDRKQLSATTEPEVVEGQVVEGQVVEGDVLDDDASEPAGAGR